MAPIKQFDIAKPPIGWGICLYGPVGIGKTTSLGTLPFREPDGLGLLVDVPQVEGGSFVLGKKKAKRIKGVKLEEWEDINEIYWALAKHDTALLSYVERVEWVAFDSITGMLELAKRKVINERDRALSDSDHKITLPEWGAIGQLVGEAVYRFQKLADYNKIWIAQEKTHGGFDDDPGPKQMGPSVTRSALLMLKPPMTIMGRMTLEGEGKQEHRILTVGPPDGEYIVKARAAPGKRLPYRIQDPDLGMILRYLFADGPKPKRARTEELFS